MRLTKKMADSSGRRQEAGGSNLYNFIFAFFFLFLSTKTIAQTDSSTKKTFYPVVDIYGHIGHLIKNYPDLPDASAIIFSEINIAYQTQGNKNWHANYRFPQIGVSLFFSDLGNKEVLGHNFCVLPNFTFRHGNISKFFGEIRLGLGLAFFDKHYDITSNPTNLYIGSTVTNISFASYDIARFVSPKFAIKAGISVFHFSNGHYQLPNIGMNIPALNVGVKYYPNEMPKILVSNSKNEYDKTIHFTARIGTGWHEFGYSSFPTGGPTYPVYAATIYASKRLSPINNIQLGFFANYYSSFYDFITSQEIYTENQHLKSSVFSIFLGHEFIVGHFGLIAEAGINIYNPFYNKFVRLYGEEISISTFLKSWSSNKLGIQYYVFSPEKRMRNNLYIGAYIKANLGQADFVEYGVGYTF